MPFGELARPACRGQQLTSAHVPEIRMPVLFFLPACGAGRKPAVIFADARGKAAAAGEAEELAGHGYIVLAPDLRGFGETHSVTRGEAFYRASRDDGNSLTALLVGKTMVGMRAADVVRGIDLLAARAD